ncbi:hypothetical protein GHK39_03800 [Sinorhizobium medicae]|uniref:hypothetical protein n=1 Tax=Sinorhizobium medicae TaxID=110321 RepID=UPI001325E0CF|nr:hypothetical protein [Sinorhizobium medicae]MDX0414788.1 hypothetical protein [Sinorhizobium medicae]MDX0900936.1 hypothetical protein [Sinorhizobium medicae]MQV83807.1 hypothetical protein [Sinorhizobium medicae]
MLLQRMRNIYCAIWTECVWQIADATDSPTKFIISDLPVTVYNRECFPRSQWCRDHNDPDIRCHATHTYFPLSLDRVLILTNLSWVRNPYQNALAFRPNPGFLGTPSSTSLPSRRIGCFLSRRFSRSTGSPSSAHTGTWRQQRRGGCIPNGKNPHWRKLGEGYLFMPEPRHIHMGGEIMIGYEGGRSDGFSEYGHKPWDRD